MSFAGTWNIVMKTPMGDREIVMLMSVDGDSLSGTMEADGNTLDIQEGDIEDGRGKWKADLTQPMPITLEFDVGVDGDAMDGSVKLGMFGNSAVTGTRA
ncbi:hypothetical protein [Hellea balneolensis]|uniref:hypothetical protein n=1 Tax=Hellea balneolensis TaxID=287478 RepID=UPI00041075C8|nr:hypothetical protein [Hellea balneolensis]